MTLETAVSYQEVLKIRSHQLAHLDSEVRKANYRIQENLRICDEQDKKYGLGKYRKTQQ